MKIVFMGTPDFAAASLRALLHLEGAQVLAAYCQPDRPAGRGQSVKIAPVKELALAFGLPVEQPQNFKGQGEISRLAAYGADIFVVAAYGLILPQAVLDIPRLGAVNVHGSLLPEYRGAAPIQRAIMNGDFRTGITIMQMERRLDAGSVLLQRALGIGVDQTAGGLHDELADLGGRLLAEALKRLEHGELKPIPQDESRATYAAKLEKGDGVLDFSRRARQVHNQARGVTPWPGAQAVLVRLDDSGREEERRNIIIERGCVLDESNEFGQEYGKLLPIRDGALPVVCCGGLYGIRRLRPSGGKSMDAAAFANGFIKGRAVSAVDF